MNKLMLDMDGVICNFAAKYFAIEQTDTPGKFKRSVMEHQIFEDLEWMPRGKELISFLDSLNVPIEILTSRGTWDDKVGAEAIRQKHVWLDKHGFKYPRNFVKIGIEKANYSKRNVILIDDTQRVVDAFHTGNGKAVLYHHERFNDIVAEIELMFAK